MHTNQQHWHSGTSPPFVHLISIYSFGFEVKQRTTAFFFFFFVAALFFYFRLFYVVISIAVVVRLNANICTWQLADGNDGDDEEEWITIPIIPRNRYRRHRNTNSCTSNLYLTHLPDSVHLFHSVFLNQIDVFIVVMIQNPKSWIDKKIQMKAQCKPFCQ